MSAPSRVQERSERGSETVPDLFVLKARCTPARYHDTISRREGALVLPEEFPDHALDPISLHSVSDKPGNRYAKPLRLAWQDCDDDRAGSGRDPARLDRLIILWAQDARTPFKPWHIVDRAGSAHRDAGPAFGPALRQDLAAPLALHPLAKSVLVLAFALAGLISPFHHKGLLLFRVNPVR